MDPRLVVVTRPTEYEGLIATHATHGQAAWYLKSRGQDIELYVQRHAAQQGAVEVILRDAPETWKRICVSREHLDRFLFTPDDIVVAVGQDGLVPNVARYACGQPVVGVNPDPQRYEGVLVNHEPEAVADILRSMSRQPVQQRTMVEARTSDGQRLLALNELFVGHQTHQSARYTLSYGDASERQSSSGVIVATGTGATGWARSIHRCHHSSLTLPDPESPQLVFFVREAWPSVATGAELTEGTVDAQNTLELTSEMPSGGRVFGDGMEQDGIELPWARTVSVGVAEEVLRLVG